MPRTMKSAIIRTLANFDRNDIPFSIFVLGLVLVGYGFSQYHHGLGLAIDGVLLVVYTKPLKRWWG